MSKSNRSKVIFCFDCDDYDVEQKDADFLKEAKKYSMINAMSLYGSAKMWRGYILIRRLMMD